MENKFPKFTNNENVVCFNCGSKIVGPYEKTGSINGMYKGWCTNCTMYTYFDWEFMNSQK